MVWIVDEKLASIGEGHKSLASCDYITWLNARTPQEQGASEYFQIVRATLPNLSSSKNVALSLRFLLVREAEWMLLDR